MNSVKPKPVVEQKPTFGTPASVSNPAKSAVAAAAAKSTSFLTPTYRPTMTTKFGSASVVRSNAESDVNPVWNGVDYSHMMAQKAQLGYTGPGYSKSDSFDRLGLLFTSQFFHYFFSRRVRLQ